MSATWAGRTPTPDEWREILEQHARWVRGIDGSRADLRGADLRGAVLRGADLRGAVLRGADLRDADLMGAVLSDAVLRGAVLRGADLRGAVLRDAVLRGADLRGAVLRGADLSDAVLRGADLSDAVLRDAVLRGADLMGADLRGADLRGAVLSDADLMGAVLRGADLRGADLSDAKGDLPIYRHQIVPESGAFTAWKQLRGGVIARLEIPSDAGRVGGLLGRKCRAERALVVWLSEGTEGRSLHDVSFCYCVGLEVAPAEPWDPSPLVECAPGIHFYITRREAEEHQ